MAAGLNNLSFSLFKAYFRIEQPIRLPRHTGPLLHNALGRSFWDVRFGMNQSCPDCSIRSECRYQNLRTYFFKSPFDHPFIKPVHDTLNPKMKRDEYPQPFVFNPLGGGGYDAGELLTFSFALVGKAIECFPFMACALSLIGGRELGPGGRHISLEAIMDGSHSDDSSESAIYDAGTGQILRPCSVIDFNLVRERMLENPRPPGNVEKVRIQFLTPFRYRFNGKLGMPLNFEILMKNLLRRLTLLSVHSPLSIEMDCRRLLNLANDVRVESSTLEWGRLRRHSFSQNEWMSLDGYVGDITFSGDLEIFLPYLRMGEFLRVGKATSFGHGMYQLEILSA